MTPCSTCSGKQSRHFDFLAMWRTGAAILIFCYYLGFWRYRYLEILTIWRTRAVILNLTLTSYVNKTTILQHGDWRDNFKPNIELCYLNNAAMLQYGDFSSYFKLMLSEI